MRSTKSFPIAIAFLAVLAHCLIGKCASAEGIVLTPPLKVGATVDLEMTMTRERQTRGQPANKAKSVTPVRVAVLEVSDKETVIGWTSRQPNLENHRLREQLGENMDPILALGVHQQMELVLDEEFTPHAIRNLDEMTKLVQAAIDLMQKSLSDDKIAAETLPRLRDLFGNPDVLQGLLIQKPGRYFLIYGWELEPGVPREAEISLPNPFGGEPLPATLTIELKPFSPTDSQLLVSYKQQLDEESVKRVIGDAMKKFSGSTSATEPQIPDFDVEDSAEFKVNRETGWVEHALVKRTTTTNEASQTEEFEFRVVELQKPK